MKLAIAFEAPIAADQIDGDGLLSECTFRRLAPIFDQVARLLARAVTGDGNSGAGCTWEIISDGDGLLDCSPPREAAPCQHPPARVYTWIAYDGTLCAACCDCGKVLAGAAAKAEHAADLLLLLTPEEQAAALGRVLGGDWNVRSSEDGGKMDP